MNKRIDWHAGFAGGLELCLSRYKDAIDIDREYELTKESPRIDFIVIKKDVSVVIDNDIGRTFKRYNLIEYKNPNDVLNMDVVWKCIGYAGLYKGLGKTVNAIPEDELTVSIFRSRYPKSLFDQCKKLNRPINKLAPGIYSIEGFSAIPIQVVVTKELKDNDLLALRIMMADADKDDIKRFIDASKDIDSPGLLEDFRAVVRISSAVNGALFEEVLKDEGVMSTIEKLEQAREKALADSKAEGRAEGLEEGRAEGLEEGRAAGKAEGKAEGIEEGQLASIRSLMETMGMSAKEAMKALKISASNQKKFVAML